MDAWLVAVCLARMFGAVAPIVFGWVLDATNASGQLPTTWGWAFIILGVGGFGAAFCARGLGHDRRAFSPSASRA